MHQFEVKMGGKSCRFVSLYRPPSQTQDDFEAIKNNFELNIDTATANYPFFKAKSNLWFKGDKATHKGSKIDGITSAFGL